MHNLDHVVGVVVGRLVRASGFEPSSGEAFSSSGALVRTFEFEPVERRESVCATRDPYTTRE